MMAGGLTLARAGVLAGGGALACGEGARGVAFVLSGFMDSGVVFFSGLAAASVTGFSFACILGAGVFSVRDGEAATVAGESGGFSGPVAAFFCGAAGVFAEERVLERALPRGWGFTFLSVRLGVMAAGLLVTFCPVDKGDTGLDCGFFTRALALG